jgi:hypothetical protein
MEQFHYEYSDLKNKYETSLNRAVIEQDPSKQQMLVQQVININQQMSDKIREFLSTMKNVNTNLLYDLTQDLIKYQQDKIEIEKSNQHIRALKFILNKTEENVKRATYKYYLYIGTLVLLAIFICILIIKSAYTKTIVEKVVSGGKLTLTSR